MKPNKLIKDILRPWYRFARNLLKPLRDHYYLNKIKKYIKTHEILTKTDIDLLTINFIDRCREPKSDYSFFFSADVTNPTLYSSVYACLAYKELGELEHLSSMQKVQWCQFFDSHQDPENGLFYDEAITDPNFDDSDWWGARHLALHMIAAYTFLGSQPKYDLKFLNNYKSPLLITNWIDSIDWDATNLMKTDIDNKIMNIGCLLQYERDRKNDVELQNSVRILQECLKQKLNSETGMWGNYRVDVAAECSAMVQFAYHLMPIFIYDGDFDFDFELIAKNVLRTQNEMGGFGCEINSSACEDIDSIDLLITCYTFCNAETKKRIEHALLRAKCWILLNHMDDGGFVFRLFQRLRYGDEEMFSNPQKSSLFPTWFRLLSLRHIQDFEDKATKPCGEVGYFTLGTILPKN